MNSNSSFPRNVEQDSRIRATTILCVRLGNQTVVIGDGQASMGAMVAKSNCRKVRRLGDGKVVAGIAGATADAMTLLEKLEQQLEQYPGQLMRASVELAKLWRSDKYMRVLEATSAPSQFLTITGTLASAANAHRSCLLCAQ